MATFRLCTRQLTAHRSKDNLDIFARCAESSEARSLPLAPGR